MRSAGRANRSKRTSPWEESPGSTLFPFCVLVLALVALLTACGGGGGGAPAQSEPCLDRLSPLGVNEVINGSLDPDDCTISQAFSDISDDPSLVDLYLLTVDESGLLTLSLRSTNFDAFLVLANATYFTDPTTNHVLQFDDDSGGGTDALIVHDIRFEGPGPVDFVVFANALSPGESGAYELQTSFVPACSSGLTQCGQNCVDLTTDQFNCGACGNFCGAGASCIEGACVCDAGFTDCNSFCTDLGIDPENCGACGVACAPRQWCDLGTCRDLVP